MINDESVKYWACRMCEFETFNIEEKDEHLKLLDREDSMHSLSESYRNMMKYFSPFRQSIRYL